jgi:CheY-like chemotaxis protein
VYLRLPTHKTVVLVVDDNDDLIRLFERYLADSPIQVIGARNAEQAMELARKARPTLITLDVMMPTHDGWEVLQNLKHHPETRAIPVAVCSILEEPHLAISLGADDYVKKPVTQKALLDLIARWERDPLAEEQ